MTVFDHQHQIEAPAEHLDIGDTSAEVREQLLIEINIQKQREIDELQESLRELQIGRRESSSGPSISGVCPICTEHLANGAALVSCLAKCGNYMHLACMRQWWYKDESKRCPLW